VAGDKFKLGEVLDTGIMLLGRITWQLFSGIWPSRDDELSRKTNAIPKLVASRSLEHVDEWANSTLLKGEVPAEVSTLRQTRDVVVTGSVGVVDELRAHDLIGQYRLLVFPAVVGEGRRLFDRPWALGIAQPGCEADCFAALDAATRSFTQHDGDERSSPGTAVERSWPRAARR
jgi:dihydrofolate reductase